MTGIEYLLDLNRRNSVDFVEAGLDRQKYRYTHPTEIAALKCMDGRLHLPAMTNTPMGIIQPYRNIGGKFDLGWFGFNHLIQEWVNYSVRRGRDCLVFTTYHYSKGDEHRGCAGFNYDTTAARTASLKLRDQFNGVFKHHTVFAIQCGIETDEDALILHGTNGNDLDLSKIEGGNNDELRAVLQKMYSDLPAKVVNDLLQIATGNIEHIKEIRALQRPIQEAEHQEWVIGVGRGFDWLHEPNTALIIGPFDPNFEQAITTAAKVVKGNIESGRIDPQNGVVLLASAPYREASGPDQELARVKAEFLEQYASEIIHRTVPELKPFLCNLTVTVDMGNRSFGYIKKDKS